MKRAYQAITVSNIIYCSSSYDHFVDVRWIRHGRRWHYSYWIDGGAIDRNAGGGALKVPAYVWQEVNRQLLEMLETGTTKFHEYDRDGNERWENLRYHDERWVPGMIEYLKGKAA